MFRRQISSYSRVELIERFVSTRQLTNSICEPLEIEDYVVQPHPDVSPPKWHLAHTTWFFEELILVQYDKHYRRFDESFRILFNSYYKSAGQHWQQARRGDLSRPTVKQLLDYRHYVNEHVVKFLSRSEENSKIDFLLEVGLEHEQQHQELLYMDIKFILGANPSCPVYLNKELPQAPKEEERWQSFEAAAYEIGDEGSQFAFDNEGPRHQVFLPAFEICEKLVTNADYLAFMQDSGYQKSQFWLSRGWDWIQEGHINSPLYWKQSEKGWLEFSLYGLRALDLQAPVTHLSYFEADAYARWTGYRLPTEEESEVWLGEAEKASESESEFLHPILPTKKSGQVWWWTKSHYSCYPGYRCYEGMLEEYNGKFMCNQFVLRGGCCVTPVGHYRKTYRNFYQPHQRWMFSGIRLAKDRV